MSCRYFCWLAALFVVLLGPVPGSADTPSFVNEVIPILTRQGCNQGACHGKSAGQNGFRLSLRGYAPDWDFVSIARELGGRRINRTDPENSLLLLKPLGLVPHGGGKILQWHGREHERLLAWIQAGAPGPSEKEPRPRRLEIIPTSSVLTVGQELPLLARAEYDDGQVKDVTWLTKFESNDLSMLAITPELRVHVLRAGENAVRGSFQGLVAVASITSPYAQVIPAERFAVGNNLIDRHVFHKLAALHIEPAPLCSDVDFVRRVYLDTIGRLPTVDEVRAFSSDSCSQKRSLLIDALLARPEFVDYWTLQFADLLQNRRERDHDVRGEKGVQEFHAWLHKQIAANRPWNELARDLLTASGKSNANPAIGYFIVTVGEQQPERSEVTASVAQAFLGTRIGCAQCHNHPLEKFTQDDFYHFAGFFSRIKMERKEPKQGPTTLLVTAGQGQQAKDPPGVVQPRTGKFLAPQPLDRSVLVIPPGQDPRIKLADWIVSPRNEAFSSAMINRIWQHYLGVGLVEPVDDLRTTNPPSNRELWEALNREFVASRFDLKQLMRLMLNSRTYQLSSATTPGNAHDTRFYSHYYARRLPAEVLLDAIAQVTDVSDNFPGYRPGTKAIELPEPGLPSYFLSLFGRSDRVTACACERNGEVTLRQLLHLQNGQGVVQKIHAPTGRLAKLLKAPLNDDERIAELFLATLSHPPSAETLAEVKKNLPSDRRGVYGDLFWALLNSKEFAFNH